MAKKKGFLERLAALTDLPDENISALPIVEITGDKRVLIEHHRGVAEYSQERICIKVKFGQVCICGQDLILSRIQQGQLIITGRLESVMLFRG